MRALLVAAGLCVGANASWAEKTTWTYSNTLANNTLGAEFNGSTDGIVKVQLGASTEAANWSVLNSNGNNRGLWAGATVTLSTDEGQTYIPVSGTFMIVKPQVDINFTLTAYSGSSTYLYLVNSETPTSRSTFNGDSRVKSYYDKETGKLLAGKTYYIYGQDNANFCYRGFTAVPYTYTELKNEIATATSLKATEGYDDGQDDFQTAISTAQSVLDDNNALRADYVAAKKTLIEAEELFRAVNTLNDTYSVGSASDLSDGKNVKSVYGITMTYHGTWTYQYNSNRGGNLAYATYPTGSTNNLPNDGDYLIFTPSVSGQLQVNVNRYKSHGTYYLVDKDNGHVFSTISGSNDYTSLKDLGTIIAGHTYYLYGLSCDWGYEFHSFKFTPKENDITSYYINSGETITGGSTIDYVNGISMTYGGTGSDSWSNEEAYSTRATRCNSKNATLSGNTPTANTFVKFNATQSGKLTVKFISYAYDNKTVTAYLSDGTNVETIVHNKDGNGVKTDQFEVILDTDETYYLYFGGGNYAELIAGFSYEITPSSVSSTIGSTGFATFSSEYPLDFSATTTKAYTASLTGENTVLLTPVTAVPANTGVLLKGATEDIPVKAGFFDYSATNLLKASTADDIAASVEGTYHYVLANGSKGVGFYNLAADKNIGTGKAYLETTTALAAASEARVAWVFADEETTGINTVRSEKANANGFYNLNGQRVSQPIKGLYIVNGKKVIMK